MGNKIGTIISGGVGGQSYVVEGATLTCTLGTINNQLQIPNDHMVYLGGKKRANVGDHIGGQNIMSFGPCHRSEPPPACIMATVMKWVGGKNNVKVDDELALINTSINICRLFKFSISLSKFILLISKSMLLTLSQKT